VATVLAFHAHPDDEVLLTGGTLAKLAARGHRVVVVVATDGVMGPVSEPGSRRRLDELRESASVLGVARVMHLGYADSGHGPVLYPDPPDRVRFARADVSEAAGKLAELVRQERADLLLSYDANGGYGHRDHVMVHEVGARAAELAGVRVLAATVPRELVSVLVAVLRPLRVVVRYDLASARRAFTPRSAITHRVDVRAFAASKRAALAAHRSQAGPGNRAARALWLLTRLPVPVFRLALGREWFAEPGTMRTGTYCGDVLEPARPRGAGTTAP
jgi:LmbE family N-acetylglucosaminyl deacetylase